ncbi:CARDB domain-containing protein [Stigmatella sp. ncwal1]|uniref:CARDB domain-containing protein n=1 Tax=Stigmatella ashevillensis TaxID=2995309 RepID=A0ABT5DFM4_9BACT|nr:CARDB domain-containing protein [Stigmatella ashevillena]MDC0712467.1 CARDB domain-containing protein [Stigmatella ashevillena]
MRTARRLRRLASGVMACGWLAGCGGQGEVGPAELFVDTLLGAVASSNAADLWVSSVNGPSSALPGSAFWATVTACNQGVRSARSTVHLLLSVDASISATDLRIGTAETGLLHPNQCATLHVPVLGETAVPEGRWYVGALIDPEDSVEELSESNNARAGLPMAFGVGPDFLLAQVEAPDSLLPSGEFLTEVTVCNTGTVSAPAHIDVFLSPEAAPTEAGLGVGSASTGPLSEGQCEVLRIPSLAAALPEGTYSVTARVDPAHAVSELEEGNNLRLGNRVTVGTRPDFVISGVRGPASLEGTAPLTVTVCNQGTTKGSAQVEAFLSADARLTASDFQVGAASLDALAPGQCAPVNLQGPVGLPPGAYFMAAWVDRSEAVQELVEDNNIRVGTRVTVGSGPDLVVTTVSALRSGESALFLRATATVCNQGTAPSPATALAFALSPSASLSASAPVLVSTEVPALLAGACASVTGSGRAKVAEGTWFIGAWVDRLDTVRELVEANNTRTGPRLGMGSGPDLVLTSVEGPSEAPAHSRLEGRVTVCNEGTLPIRGLTRVALYLSSDTFIRASDRRIGEVAVPVLSPGQCVTVAPPSNGGLPEGRWFLGALVDRGQDEAELIEDNNALTGSPLTVGTPERWVVSSRL